MASQVRGSYFYKQSQVAIKYMKKLMGAKVFDNPKDHEELLKLFRYIAAGTDNAIILDFFAGSGTTAEAVMQLNSEDHTQHKFILVQLPELCNPKERTGKAAIAAGFATVSEIAKDRVRRPLLSHSGDTGEAPLFRRGARYDTRRTGNAD